MPRVNLRQYPWALLLVWVVPILVVLSLCATLRLFEGSNGILLGLLIAAAMPVANSSVGWAHLGRGNLPLTLALLLGATITAPFIAPTFIYTVAATCLPDPLRADRVLPLGQLAGFLGFWVVAPTLSGAVIGLWSRRQGVIWSALWLRRVSMICILLLNYINASAALPLIRSESLVLQGLVWTGINLTLLLFFGWLASRLLKVGKAEQVSLTLACGMRNTGAALVLAGSQFQQEPVVIMTIVLQTLLQNVFAALLIALMIRKEPEPFASLSQTLNQCSDNGQAAGTGTGNRQSPGSLSADADPNGKPVSR